MRSTRYGRATTIATSAIQNLLGGDMIMRMSRKPEIMADAAYAIFNKKAAEFTGHFLIDDSFLYGEGVRDFEHYRMDPTQPLAPVFFTPDEPSAATGRCDWRISRYPGASGRATEIIDIGSIPPDPALQ